MSAPTASRGLRRYGHSKDHRPDPVTLFSATGWWLLAAGTGMTYYPCR